MLSSRASSLKALATFLSRLYRDARGRTISDARGKTSSRIYRQNNKRGVGEKTRGDGRETEALANLSAIKKKGWLACVGRFSRSDSPCRPSFSCLTKFTTRFSFLTIASFFSLFCGILGKISMHDGPSIAASFLPPRHYRGGTNVRGSESFARDSSQVFTLFRRFSFHVYHRCWEFFLLVLFTILL